MSLPEEIDLDGHVDAQGVHYIGKARREKWSRYGIYRCLADVGGALCIVECRVEMLVAKGGRP